MMETTAGLPNSCYQCATPVTTGSWFARNIDEARSGKGFCADCLVKEATAPAPNAVTIEEAPLPDFLQERDDLTKITGLGSTSAKKLKQAGIDSFVALADADPAALAAATGISQAKLTVWIDELTSA